MCEYEENKYLKYKDDEALNYIDLKEKIYTRENNDFFFKIDFQNKKFKYLLKEKNYKLEDNLDNCSIIENKKIILKYSLDTEEKEIIIHLL